MTMPHTHLARVMIGVALPASLLHELLHALVALPKARRVDLSIQPHQGTATAHVYWPAETSHLWVALSALAPMLAGALALTWALVQLATGHLGSGLTDSALLAIAGAYLGLAARPSWQDIRVATGTNTDG